MIVPVREYVGKLPMPSKIHRLLEVKVERMTIEELSTTRNEFAGGHFHLRIFKNSKKSLGYINKKLLEENILANRIKIFIYNSF
jgi:hypothetical protein